MSVNKAIIVGNVGKKPDVHTSEAGTKIVSFSVATSERWTDKNTGEKKEKTEWHRVVCFGGRDNDGLAGVAEKFLDKGSKVYVEGKLQTRSWEDKQGQKRYVTEIVALNVQFIGGGRDRPQGAEAGGQQRSQGQAQSQEYDTASIGSSGFGGPETPGLDDIPF